MPLSIVRTGEPARLSREIRSARDPLTGHRRQIVGLSMVSAACMGIIALYQVGAIRHLPEPPLPGLDADAVDASEEAYAHLAVGDAFLGFVSYGVTMLLAAAGGPDRHATQPWLSLAMAAKAGVDAVGAAALTVEQWVRHRAFCSWCLTAAAATFVVVPLVVPEARLALARVRAGRQTV